MKRPVSIMLLAVLPVLHCSASTDDSNLVIAVVNGTEITVDRAASHLGKGSAEDFSSLTFEEKSQLVMSLINRQLVLERARKEGFDQSPDIKDALQDLADTFVVEQYLLKVAGGFDLSEESMMRYYADHYSDTPEQYHVSHILLNSEEEARALLGQLSAGAGFSSLAATASMDRVSADKGGSLGWLSRDDMVPSFYRAVSALSDGAVSEQPVRSQFGWHIARLDGRRTQPRRTFSEVSPEIQQQMIKEQMAAYFDDLRDKATIEIR